MCVCLGGGGGGVGRREGQNESKNLIRGTCLPACPSPATGDNSYWFRHDGTGRQSVAFRSERVGLTPAFSPASRPQPPH